MTGAVTVSVVIVSRGRPSALNRCLTAVAQLDHPRFEVVVVACPAGMARLRARPDAAQIKQVDFDAANISAARNAGITVAAGAVLAFLDDDAVPEPLWLRHLCAPLAEGAEAAGGYVLGRNGISLQWGARSVDHRGQTHALALAGQGPQQPDPGPGRAVKTEGTNMAVTRAALAALGGFDPALRFYADETDLNMRLAAAGCRTALVPLAQVHHGFAESPRRAADRTPRDLFEIGAAQRVFLRKHCPEPERAPAWAQFRASQRRRLLAYMQRGPLDAAGVWRLMRSLDRGGREGARRPLAPLPPLPEPEAAFLPYPSAEAAPRACFSGRSWQAAARRAAAEAAVTEGAIASLFLFSPTALFHRVSFSETGVWEQRGGLFGRSRRDGPLVQPWRFSRRVAAERERIAPVRG